jgi:bifunctional non-homologous end joining protein LigD
MPSWIEPMKALLVAGVPEETPRDRWAYEIKWDGVRTLAFAGGGDGQHFKLFSRNHLDATFRYPELAELGKALGRRNAILDGEIIALDPHGNPDFPLLQKRMNVTKPSAVEKAAREIQISFVLFDVLYLDGRDLRSLPWEKRRGHLDSLAPLLPPACRLSPVQLGSKHRNHGGEDMLDVARQKGLEGIVGKRLDSPYEDGLRTGAWVKVKLVGRQELVVAGWVPEVSLDGKVHKDHVGALLLGYYDKSGRAFHMAGAVGTGFTNASSRAMVNRLKPLATSNSPFAEDVAIRKFRAPIQWVKPRIVVEVEYRRWPKGGLMHQAAFKGLRTDKPATDVIRELPT